MVASLVDRSLAVIERVDAHAYSIPTDAPESDGTLEWDSTTLVVAEIAAAGEIGLGYTYSDPAAGRLIRSQLVPLVLGSDPMNIPASWNAMVRATRNLGRPGLVSSAIAAVDVALWDLKAKLLGHSLLDLLGGAREQIPAYGSGGFTSYSEERLAKQLGDWAQAGLERVKMKVGREPRHDQERARVAREAIGPRVELFVDANGAYSRKQALAMAEQFAEIGVSWFEEPVSSDDLDGLRLLRDRGPAGMDIAAGEYGYDLGYFRRMLQAGSVDVLQADGSRCAGISGFLQVGALCDAFAIPLSAHTAPSLHAAVCCAVGRVCHVEYFYDHARIEHLFFDGAATPVQGALKPDRTRPGLGLEFKRSDAARFEKDF